ncbi:MAG TPA: rhodanese-like domain-containing protein [Oceanipulchritudo sp.]|nr:rhodanese-like domain-containing protein [Oceanipulchritudo sp.]
MNCSLHPFLSSRTARSCIPALLLLLAGAVPLTAAALSVEELADRLVDGELRFLIDVRRTHSYAEGHIPNAVNIPLEHLQNRRLPRIGEVIVYGDGLGQLDMEKALQYLAAKPGIEPVLLEGGYAAWETRSGVTTAKETFRKRSDPTITYQNLRNNKDSDLVIYDLRKGGGSARESLRNHFPDARIGTGSPEALLPSDRGRGGGASLMASRRNPLLKGKAPSTDELIVLVDDDHSSAAALAQRLRAGGLKRVAVLAGGEFAMEFNGRPGFERRGQASIKMPVPGTDNPDEGTEENP